MNIMSATIMVVDDDPAISTLISHQLRSLGYRTVCLRDGLQALQQMAIIQPDLVLLDVMMPHMSGWDICRQIRACSEAPIILLTAKDADADVINGLNAGADDYVTKPYRIAQLHARIEAALRRSVQRTRPRPAARVGSASDGSRLSPPAPSAPQTLETAPTKPPVTTPRLRLGATLREERLRRGVSLYQAEQICRVRWDYLQAIEQEQWEYVPQARRQAAIRAYAAYLGVPLRYPQPRRASLASVAAPLVAVALMLVVVVVYFL
ncbi:response regulator [Roseiflexus castenholzii]|uniref:Response regulator receiver protein n=1 Tax=Roseiflexus castenholzii (strain DSM 13941 / HLO8) TaxID=383372 RepID=A7NFA3_ROSCS|nr:response regulator [Roseiflexus castenholzii]ABU58369.1 response regulator receiver protein [Roseiflexus castenholzii DSM 13941]